MHALTRAGDRAAAIRHARLHARLLRVELDAEPDSTVMALADQLSRAPSPPPIGAASGQEDIRPTAAAAVAVVPASAVGRLPASTAALHVRRRFTVEQRRLGHIAAGLLVLFSAAVFAQYRTRGNPDPPRLVVFGDIVSPDTVLSLAVRVALRAELERTNDVVVLGDEAVANTLRLMELPPTARLTESVAEDVAIRRGVPLVVAGRAVALGDGMQIVVRLVDARRNTAVATLGAAPLTAADVVPAVARLGEQLRERVSTLPPIAASPLPAVTTSSRMSVELFQSAFSSVEENTYLRIAFIASGYGPVCLGMTSAKYW